MLNVIQNKAEYATIADTVSADLPLFAQPWYLDAACGTDGWDALVVYRNEAAIGAMAIPVGSKQGFKLSTNKTLLPYVSIWVHVPDDMKAVSAAQQQFEVYRAIAEHLPAFDRINLKFHHTFTNWLPFYWQGFEQTTHYTYVIEAGSDMEAVRMEYATLNRRAIKKAQKLNVKVDNDISVDQLLDQVKRTFGRQDQSFAGDIQAIHRVFEACKQRGLVTMYGAKGEDGKLHSAIMVLNDRDMSYYVLGGGDPELRSSGAMTLIMDQAVADALGTGRSFNFEGSMIEGVESFFRSFGGQLTPVMKLTQTRSFMLRLAGFIKAR